MLRLWIILVLTFAPKLMAIDVTSLSDSEALLLGPRLDVWDNRGEAASEDAVLSGQMSAQFTPSQVDYPSAGFSHGEFWGRFTLTNPGTEVVTLWLESRTSLMDRVSVFAPDAKGIHTVRHQGDRLEFSGRDLTFRLPAFRLTVYPGTHTYYVRTSTTGSNMLALFLWKEKGFDRHRWQDNIVLGAMLGVLIALLFYNSFLAFSLKSRTYYYYVAFLFFMINMQFSMQGIWLFLFQHETATWLLNQGLVFIVNATQVAVFLVTVSFLNMKHYMPRWYRVLQLSLSIIVAISIAGIFVSYNTFAKLTSNYAAIGSLVLITCTFVAVLRGYRPARYYCLSWFFFLGAGILNALHFEGLLHPSFTVQYNNLPGAVLEGLLMSLALADRVIYIRQKSEKTIRDLNSELALHVTKVEKIVQERTQTIRVILDHVTSGLLIVDRTGTIQGGYSRSCCELLSHEHIAGQLFSKLLGLKESEAVHFRMCLDQTFAELMPVDVCLDQLPKSVNKDGKVLQLGANAVRTPEGTLEHILFTIQDVTELRRRQAESRRNRLLIRILGDISAFRHFIGASYEALQRLKNPMALHELKFLLHTLKGNSQVFRLTRVARTIHEIEGMDQIGPQEIATIEKKIQKFLESHQKLLKVSWGPQQDELTVSLDKARELTQLIQSVGNETLTLRVEQWVQEIMQPSIEALMKPMIVSCQNTARKLGKSVFIRLDSGRLHTRSSQETMVLELLIHVLRNAVVHGIENEREKLGKSKNGHVELSFIEEKDALHIRCRDDGQGFIRSDWEAAGQSKLSLSAAAVRAMSLQDLVFAVAQAGYSTRESLSLEAGRGIGLGGFIQIVRESGGRMELHSEDGQGSCFDIWLPRETDNFPSRSTMRSA